jgi:hypothetical protein
MMYLRNAYRFRPSLVSQAVRERHEELFCEDVKLLLQHFKPSAWGALFLALAELSGRGRLSSDAMLIMAVLANYGIGVPQDKGLAQDLEQQAAALANPVGVFFTCITSGDLTKAALLGHCTAALFYSYDLDRRSSDCWPRYAIQRVLADHYELLLAARDFSLEDLVYIIRGADRGRKSWHIVLVNPDLLGGFWSKLNDEIIHLDDHGFVMRSAYGDSAPAKEKEEALAFLENFCPKKVPSSLPV